MRVVGEEYKITLKSKIHSNNNKVQFMHEFFQRGRSDLLHRISRVTKAQLDQPPAHYSSDMKTLKDEIADLHQDILSVSQQFDQRLQAVMVAVESDFQQRMNSVALSYQTLSALSGQLLTTATTTSTLPSSLQPNMVHSTMATPGRCCHLPPPPPSPEEEGSAPSDVMEYLKTTAVKADAISSATTAVISNYHHNYGVSFPSSIATISGTATPKLTSTRYVTDGSSISSREDAAPESASRPQLQKPAKCALSLLSGIATAMMQELET
jgi:hypothetical protein